MLTLSHFSPAVLSIPSRWSRQVSAQAQGIPYDHTLHGIIEKHTNYVQLSLASHAINISELLGNKKGQKHYSYTVASATMLHASEQPSHTNCIL